MRYKKKEMLQNVSTLLRANDSILKYIASNPDGVVETLTICQESAMLIGNYIETLGESYTYLVKDLEDYCENLYQISIHLSDANQCKKITKNIQKQLCKIEHAIRYDLPGHRKEMVFLPYKASMWDSLESVWKAADADENIDAYVIPIPYFKRQEDGKLGEEHYEADLYPDYVPITDYREYDFEERMPDAIFIHNPYDYANFVLTIHPYFYSENLKKFTDCLVYIPYYSTSGEMAEAQSLCPAYIHADYIVTQAEKYRKFFDPEIPDEKFLPFGSPKFDSVIHKCQNPPEPPAEWKKLMKGKKVYFYNTSINGMLGNTENFLKKMEYVFDTFKGREDACLLWRPHPLLESTFDSMRSEYRREYDRLKQRFMDEKLGIYDDTPNIENAVAFSDAYVGDSGSSVTSLFGVVGKPLFILDNAIHKLPDEDSWKGIVYHVPTDDFRDQYVVVYGNMLFYAPNNDYRYEYFCDLSEYAGGNYYSQAYQFGDMVYVFPHSAEHILAIDSNKCIRRIELKHECEQQDAFGGAVVYDDYVYILPGRYSALIRFDPKTEKVEYLPDIGPFNFGMVNNENTLCARAYQNGKFFFMDTTGKQLLIVDLKAMKTEIVGTTLDMTYRVMIPEKDDSDIFWLLPFEGTSLTRWNYRTGGKREYNLYVDGLKAYYAGQRNVECDSRYFSSLAITDDAVYTAPLWGNMFVKLDIKSGKAESWESPFEVAMAKPEGYSPSWSVGSFLPYRENARKYYFYYEPLRKSYDIDLHTGAAIEIEQTYQYEDLLMHAPGFAKESQWMQYCCKENAFHTLKDFLDGTLPGKPFDKEVQLAEFQKINASVDGKCGEKVIEYLKKTLE